MVSVLVATRRQKGKKALGTLHPMYKAATASTREGVDSSNRNDAAARRVKSSGLRWEALPGRRALRASGCALEPPRLPRPLPELPREPLREVRRRPRLAR